MPEYVYRAVTDKGLIVKNKVEDSSKQSLIRRLKHNGLMPIQVVQVGYKSKKNKKTKKKYKQYGRYHENSKLNQYIK